MSRSGKQCLPRGSIEIPGNEGVGFFNSFSHQHQGWPVSLEISNSDPSNLQTPYLRLKDIEVNSEDGSEDIIIIFIGRPGGLLRLQTRQSLARLQA